MGSGKDVRGPLLQRLDKIRQKILIEAPLCACRQELICIFIICISERSHPTVLSVFTQHRFIKLAAESLCLRVKITSHINPGFDSELSAFDLEMLAHSDSPSGTVSGLSSTSSASTPVA